MSEGANQAEIISQIKSTNEQEPVSVNDTEPITPAATSTTPTTSLLSETQSDHQNGGEKSPTKPSFWTRMKHTWSDTWMLEILALSISWTFGSAIGIVLGVFDNQPLPSLPKGLTMNTIIAVFSTVSKSSLLLVVSSCISQLKWRWYRQSRKLNDMQVFEDASRGPLGALRIVFHYHVHSVASAGAIILILALLFEPFVQQSLAYPNLLSLQPVDTAVVQRSLAFFPNITKDLNTFIPDSVHETVNSAFWGNISSVPDIQCPSPFTDCTWESFPSLELCYACGRADPAPKLNCSLDFFAPNQSLPRSVVCNLTMSPYPDQQLTLTLAVLDEGQTRDRITAPVYAMYMLGNLSSWRSPPVPLLGLTQDAIQGIKAPLLGFNIFTFNITTDQYVIINAEQCAVGFCLRDYSLSVKNNTPIVDSSKVRYGQSFPVWSNDTDGDFGYCWVADNETFVPDPNQDIYDCHYINDRNTNQFSCTHSDTAHLSFCTYQMVGKWQSAWQEVIMAPFSDSANTTSWIDFCPHRNGSTVVCEQQINGDGSLSLAGSDPSSAGYDPRLARVFENGIDTILGNIINSINMINRQTYPTWVTGKAGTPTSYVHVRWAWLALPLALIVAGSVLLIWTMIDTRRNKSPLWKGSVLALLFHGLEPDQLRDRHVPEIASKMEALADGISSVLKFSEVEGRTALVSSRSEPANGQGLKKPVWQCNAKGIPATFIGQLPVLMNSAYLGI